MWVVDLSAYNQGFTYLDVTLARFSFSERFNTILIIYLLSKIILVNIVYAFTTAMHV